MDHVNRLSGLLQAEDVRVGLCAADKLELFAHAALLFAQHMPEKSVSIIAESLIARERLGSTGLGHGVAIPHCRVKGLKKTLAAMVLLDRPLAFEAPDAEPVSLLIFLFVRELASQSDLEVLGEIAEMLSDAGMRERLKKQKDARTLHQMLSQWSPGGTTARWQSA